MADLLQFPDQRLARSVAAAVDGLREKQLRADKVRQLNKRAWIAWAESKLLGVHQPAWPALREETPVLLKAHG